MPGLPRSAIDEEEDEGRPAVRRTGPLLLPSSRGTARRAPTEILEQDRPHQIAPILTRTVRGTSSTKVDVVSVRGFHVVTRPEMATTNFKLELLFERVPVVDVQFPADR